MIHETITSAIIMRTFLSIIYRVYLPLKEIKGNVFQGAILTEYERVRIDEYTYLSPILGVEKVDDYWLKHTIKREGVSPPPFSV